LDKKILINKLIDLFNPIVTELGYEFYYLEFVEEDGENFLRIYIDSGNGIGLSDCEKVSRRISETLDEEDPISSSYYLEVSSPGVFRTLFTDEHLNKYINSNISLDLNKLYEGKRNLEGKLIKFDSDNIIIYDENNEFSIPRNTIDKVILKGEL
jgi:ribosome maturation factor RimP